MKRKMLMAIHLLVGLTAVAGGVALIVTNGLGMYASSVQPLFYNYTIPGYILSVVIGGTNLFALYALVKKSRYQHEASATAGFGLLIWLFFELYITNLSNTLQVIYFALGIDVLILNLKMLKQNQK